LASKLKPEYKNSITNEPDMKICTKTLLKKPQNYTRMPLVHDISDISKLVRLYAMINMMRVISSRNTVECADKVGRMIVNTYLAPEKTLPELHDMVNRGDRCVADLQRSCP
jgi:hypothetical protein